MRWPLGCLRIWPVVVALGCGEGNAGAPAPDARTGVPLDASTGPAVGEAGHPSVNDGGADGAEDSSPGPASGPGDGAASIPPPDATASGDDGPDGAPSSVGCPAGALLCEDFEKYSVGGDLAAGGWRVNAAQATVVVDATKPFQGTRGLHLVGPRIGDHYTALILREGAPMFPMPGNSFYGRMMMWVSEVPTGGVHFNNVQSSGYLAGSTQFAKYGLGAMFASVMASYTLRNDPNGAPIVDCAKGGGGAIPTKQWVCVEWQFDGANDGMHYWFDGKDISDVVGSAGKCVAAGPPGGAWKAPAFANIQLGWAQYQSGGVPLEMWIDDIVIDNTARVGCPMP